MAVLKYYKNGEWSKVGAPMAEGVTSVNGMTGDVTIEMPEVDYPVTSVNGKTGDVTLSASDVGALPDTTAIPSIEGLATESYVDEKVGSIEVPVTSVNGQTGDITIKLPDNILTTTITIPAGRMRGDVNGDGKLDSNEEDDAYNPSSDAILVFSHYTHKITLTDETQLLCADINQDGRINASDASVIMAIADGKQRIGAYGEITGNWTINPNYATEEAQFYTDIAVPNLTATSSATVVAKGSHKYGNFCKVECLDGILRVYAKLCPIEDCVCTVYYSEGAASTSTKFDTTLSASSWSSGQYTVSNSAITSTSVVELLPASSITKEQYEALAGAMIIGGEQAAGSIKLKALGEVPTVNIPVTFIVRGDM